MVSPEQFRIHLTSIGIPSWSVSVLDSLREGVIVECADHVMYANRSYANLLGFDEGAQLVGIPVRQLIAPEDEMRLLGFAQRRARNEAAPLCYTFTARRADGSSRRLFASIAVTTVGRQMLITTMVRPIRSEGGLQDAGRHHLDALSEREHQVLRMLLADKRPKEIAFALEISEKTVATHRRRLYDKLGFRNAQDLFRFGVQNDLIDWS